MCAAGFQSFTAYCAFLSRGACGHCRISVLHGVVCFLEQGSLCALQDSSPSRRSVLSVVFLEIIDEILPCSSELIPHRSRDH